MLTWVQRMVIIGMVDFKSLTCLMPVQENNPLPLKAADQFIFPSSSCGAVVYPLFFPILTRVSRIDSKSEKLERILVYGPWQEKRRAQREILKERNPIFLLVQCSVCGCSDLAGMKAAPGSVSRVIVWSRGAQRPSGRIRV